MTSDPGATLDAMWTNGQAAETASDEAWLRAMVEVEVALAAACAALGLIDASDARRIEAAAVDLALDTAAIAREAAASGTPIIPLVERIRAAVGPAAADAVHWGATSQDIVDSATMRIASRTLEVVLQDLTGALRGRRRPCCPASHDAHRRADAAAARRPDHVRTGRPRPGCSGSTAQPTGYGRSARRVSRSNWAVRPGRSAAYGDQGQRLAAEMAERLGLSAPVGPWHTERTRIGDLAASLGVLAGSVAKPARDIVLLAQTEVAEVEEGVAGRGSSSAMPHKHNPVAAISAIACAQRSVGLVATLLGAMVQEHERGAGSWQAEWLPLRQLLVTAGSATGWLRDSLEHLVIRRETMARNLGSMASLDVGIAPALVDSALQAHRARARP